MSRGMESHQAKPAESPFKGALDAISLIVQNQNGSGGGGGGGGGGDGGGGKSEPSGGGRDKHFHADKAQKAISDALSGKSIYG